MLERLKEQDRRIRLLRGRSSQETSFSLNHCRCDRSGVSTPALWGQSGSGCSNHSATRALEAAAGDAAAFSPNWHPRREESHFCSSLPGSLPWPPVTGSQWETRLLQGAGGGLESTVVRVPALSRWEQCAEKQLSGWRVRGGSDNEGLANTVLISMEGIKLISVTEHTCETGPNL